MERRGESRGSGARRLPAHGPRPVRYTRSTRARPADINGATRRSDPWAPATREARVKLSPDSGDLDRVQDRAELGFVLEALTGE